MDDTQTLEIIKYAVCLLVTMRICEWVVVACKWLHNWLSSLFPTDVSVNK